MDYIPCVTAHAQHRAAERFGSWLSNDEWHDIVWSIISSRAELVRQDDVVDHWKVTIRGLPATVVWKPAAGVILTLLREKLPRPVFKRRASRTRHAERAG